MRTVILIVVALGLILVAIGLIAILRARIAQAMEQRRVERGDPEIIEGRARIVDKTERGTSSSKPPGEDNNRTGRRRDSG